MREVSIQFSPEYLKACILYASNEPCPRCAEGIFWSSIRRVVFELTEAGLDDLMDPETTEEVLLLLCRDIFQRGQKEIEIIGPLLEVETQQVHLGF